MKVNGGFGTKPDGGGAGETKPLAGGFRIYIEIAKLTNGGGEFYGGGLEGGGWGFRIGDTSCPLSGKNGRREEKKVNQKNTKHEGFGEVLGAHTKKNGDLGKKGNEEKKNVNTRPTHASKKEKQNFVKD